MTSIADASVSIQTSSERVPSTPAWFGEVALIVPYLRRQGIFSAISSHVRLVRRRFGHYEVIDFLAVLFGYEILGERTLEAFYERLLPLAQPFMALFAPREIAVPLGTLALSCKLERFRPPKPCARSFSPICSRVL